VRHHDHDRDRDHDHARLDRDDFDMRRFHPPRDRDDSHLAAIASSHHFRLHEWSEENRHVRGSEIAPPTHPKYEISVPSHPMKGEYLRWGDWSKADAQPYVMRGRLNVSSYHRDSLADPERLKIANYRSELSGHHVDADLAKHHHEAFAVHGQRGNGSISLRQSLNMNRMNFLGGGVISVPRK
jgi:hypothetical protein